MSSQKTAERPTAVAIINDLRAEIAPIASQSGISYDRIATAFRIAVQQNPDILKCSLESLRRELSKCAVDGLVPDNKEAVILPYWDKDDKIHHANYQPMVYGVIKRMKELGSVFNIICELVCEKDTFTFNAADADDLVHTWDVFSEEDRGATRAAYVIFRDDQKRVMHREILSRKELDAIRAASKAPNSPAWRNFEGEMFQKATIRRGSKFITINNDAIRELLERMDSMFDYADRKPETKRSNPFGGTTIDLDPSSGEISSSPQSSEPSSSQGSDTKDVASEPQEAASDTKPEPLKVKVKEGDFQALDMLLNEVVDLTDPMPMVTPVERLAVIKAKSQEWKGKLPEYLHDTLRWVMGLSTTAVKAQQAEADWQPALVKGLAEVQAETGVTFKQGWL